MKVVILSGGLGSRLGELTKLVPKPMINICRKPILSHIISHYYKYGYDDFILATGYKSKIIKDYYTNSDNYNDKVLTLIKNKKIKINPIFTGKNSMTGGRIKRLSKYLKNEKIFLLTYGDGISDVNINKLVNFHNKQKRLATVTAVHPTARFGEIILKKNLVISFKEKPQTKKDWINGGFFVFNTKILKYINNDKTILEGIPLEKLSKLNQLSAYRHKGFWHCMDTPRDKKILENLIKRK